MNFRIESLCCFLTKIDFLNKSSTILLFIAIKKMRSFHRVQNSVKCSKLKYKRYKANNLLSNYFYQLHGLFQKESPEKIKSIVFPS